jgi:hypothetical protein
MSVPRYGHTIHMVGGKVLVVGGVDADNVVLQSTEIFHPAGENANTFTEGPAIPGAVAGNNESINGPGRAFHAGASINANTVMVGGGIDDKYKLARALLYFLADKGTITAQSRAVTLETPVVQGAAGVVADKFVMVGGTTGFNTVGWSWTSSSATRQVQWTEPTSAPGAGRTLQLGDPARYGACVVPMDENRLLVAGGIEQMRNAIDTAEVLVWNADKKTVERSFIGDSADRSSMSEGRAWATCTNLGDGRILVAGGANGEQGSAGSSAEIFTIRTR